MIIIINEVTTQIDGRGERSRHMCASPARKQAGPGGRVNNTQARTLYVLAYYLASVASSALLEANYYVLGFENPTKKSKNRRVAVCSAVE